VARRSCLPALARQTFAEVHERFVPWFAQGRAKSAQAMRASRSSRRRDRAARAAEQAEPTLSDSIANAPAAHRAAGGADSTADMSSADFAASGTALTNNRGAIAVWAAFATAGATCVLTPVLYDSTPAPMALGPSLAFAASAKRISSSGAVPQAADGPRVRDRTRRG
jgi:hypothetical protein